jgi:tRNA pseudouridine38-40 synthase
MLLAYDGSTTQGWQIQRNGPSVQGRLEEALRIITRYPAQVHGSGRTDSGVHALGQVASFRVPPGLTPHLLRARLNGLVGPEIVVKAIVPVPADFHARHRARGKLYRYRLFNCAHPPVFARTHCWWLRRPLALDAMRAAAAHLVGEHDFSAFRAKDCAAPHAVRTLRRLDLLEHDEPDCTLSIELEATGFLQHMARILTGTLVQVGQGKLASEAVPALLAGRRRMDVPATAPPGGLHLVRVDYDLDAYPTLRAFL